MYRRLYVKISLIRFSDVGSCISRHSIGQHFLGTRVTYSAPVAVRHPSVAWRGWAARQRLVTTDIASRRRCFVGCITKMLDSFFNNFSWQFRFKRFIKLIPFILFNDLNKLPIHFLFRFYLKLCELSVCVFTELELHAPRISNEEHCDNDTVVRRRALWAWWVARREKMKRFARY